MSALILNVCFIFIFFIFFIVLPSQTCNTNIKDKEGVAQCNICQFRIHRKCNNINHIYYKYLQESNDCWFCISCCSVPFGTLTNKNFLSMTMMINSSHTTFKVSDAINISTSSSLTLKPSANVSLSFNLSNTFSS